MINNDRSKYQNCGSIAYPTVNYNHVFNYIINIYYNIIIIILGISIDLDMWLYESWNFEDGVQWIWYFRDGIFQINECI